ncbi:MAG TPA: hypothetical protein VIY29_29400, partial [Ktedonobacteraceae bacterium]
DIIHNGGQWEAGASGICFTERASGGVVHDDEWDAISQAEIQYTYDVRVHQANHGTCLIAELLYLIFC